MKPRNTAPPEGHSARPVCHTFASGPGLPAFERHIADAPGMQGHRNLLIFKELGPRERSRGLAHHRSGRGAGATAARMSAVNIRR